MDHIDDTNSSRWVQNQLAALTTPADWEPDYDRTRQLFQAKQRAARRRRTLAGTALAILIVAGVVLMVPTTRGIADRLLNRFNTRNVEAVRLTVPESELKDLFPKIEFTALPRMSHRVESIAQAEQEAGFAPLFPKEFREIFKAGSIVLGVRRPIAWRIRIKVANLRAALQKRGIQSVTVPGDWDGVEIKGQGSYSIVANFKDGTFEQSRLPVLSVPSNFPVADFIELELMIAGLSAAEAHRLRDKFTESGGMFTTVPSDARYTFREVELAAGHGMLFQNQGADDQRDRCAFCPGPDGLALIWTNADRLFRLSTDTLTVDEAIQLANSVETP